MAAILPGLGLVTLACSRGDASLPPAYRDLTVPQERLAAPAARERGRSTFRRHCALCHGERGDGRGARRTGFPRPPADFGSPAWRRQATPRRVFHAIREGVHGTAMPSWRALDDGTTWDLVAFVLAVGRERE